MSIAGFVLRGALFEAQMVNNDPCGRKAPRGRPGYCQGKLVSGLQESVLF